MVEPSDESPKKSLLIQGNIAVAEAAIKAGCRFFGGYPITPSSEIMVRMAQLLRRDDGVFIQMEDELASICSVIGASWSGAKAMTATSGPGLSLMQEAIGYAYFTETPMVLVDVQRAGPATGQATHVGQGDVMQYKYGSHGDVFPIALSPWSVQEQYDLTIRAFNLAEQYRTPVFLAADEAVGHLRENVLFHDDFEVLNRRRTGEGDPFGSNLPDGVPVMPAFGDGQHLMVTGSTHNPQGFRKVDDPEVHDTLVTRLMRKTMDHVDEISEVDMHMIDDAKYVFFAYGISARSALAACKRLRAKGIKAGLLRAVTLWPFPDKQVTALGNQIKAFIVPELNKGMMAGVVSSFSKAEVHPVTQTNGKTIKPERLVRFVEELL